jgi:hypothetical protein
MNKSETFNEVCVIMTSYVLMWINDSSLDPEAKFDVGKVYMYAVGFNLSINAVMFLKDMCMN